MFHKLIVAAAWACLAFIAYATLYSIGSRPVLAGGFFNVIERFGAYTVLGLFFHLAYPRHLTFVCIVVFGSAVTPEVLQNLAPDRDPRDLGCSRKLLGGTAGIVLGLITETGRPRRD